MTHDRAVEHFTSVAGAYAAYRPNYPAALFDWLAEVAPARGLAWDCGAGSGQATRDLAQRFGGVVATDASRAQLRSLLGASGVAVWSAVAEHSGIRAARVDLVAVAQALHWFDLRALYAEVRRVLRRRGVVAVWTYADPQLEGAPGPALHAFARAMRPWWPAGRALVESGYQTIPFPFAEFPPPALTMTADWSIDALVGYLGTWSAVGAYRKAQGDDPIPRLRAALAPGWGDPRAPRRVTWKLSLRAGRV
jgi:SAM-dependent methyltransferase